MKLYYLGPMFRYERPQAGRYRQFHQFGVECFGSSEPSLDAEVIVLAYSIYTKLGAKNVQLKLNSIGCPNCRPKYLEKLKEALKERRDCCATTAESVLRPILSGFSTARRRTASQQLQNFPDHRLSLRRMQRSLWEGQKHSQAVECRVRRGLQACSWP